MGILEGRACLLLFVLVFVDTQISNCAPTISAHRIKGAESSPREESVGTTDFLTF